MDQYKTIKIESEGLFKDRSSKFIAVAMPFTDEQTLADILTIFRKRHPKAGHHCYAYRLGTTGDTFRANDDGEPSGTAGRPILGQIDSFGITNVLIVVTRYWGGTKLGTSGLKNAYKTAATLALEEAEIVLEIVKDRFRIEFEYGKMSQVMNAVKNSNFEILKQHFEESAFIEIAIRASESKNALHQLGADIAEKIPEVYDPKFDQMDWKIIHIS